MGVCFFPTRDNPKALKNQVMVFILLNDYTDKKAYKAVKTHNVVPQFAYRSNKQTNSSL
jgi:hypothetical protein